MPVSVLGRMRMLSACRQMRCTPGVTCMAGTPRTGGVAGTGEFAVGRSLVGEVLQMPLLLVAFLLLLVRPGAPSIASCS